METIEDLKAQLAQKDKLVEAVAIGRVRMPDDSLWRYNTKDNAWFGLDTAYGTSVVKIWGDFLQWKFKVPPITGGENKWVEGSAVTLIEAMTEATRILRERWAAVEAGNVEP
jgi:hypothetical protein